MEKFRVRLSTRIIKHAGLHIFRIGRFFQGRIIKVEFYAMCIIKCVFRKIDFDPPRLYKRFKLNVLS